jgi:hypothetical protein
LSQPTSSAEAKPAAQAAKSIAFAVALALAFALALALALAFALALAVVIPGFVAAIDVLQLVAVQVTHDLSPLWLNGRTCRPTSPADIAAMAMSKKQKQAAPKQGALPLQ